MWYPESKAWHWVSFVAAAAAAAAAAVVVTVAVASVGVVLVPVSVSAAASWLLLPASPVGVEMHVSSSTSLINRFCSARCARLADGIR